MFCVFFVFSRPDAYNFYVTYVDSTLKLLASKNNTACDETDALVMQNSELIRDNFNKHENELLQVDSSIEACRDFLQKCQERTASPYKLRGPHVAMLYLYKKLVDEGYEATKYLGSLIIRHPIHLSCFLHRLPSILYFR